MQRTIEKARQIVVGLLIYLLDKFSNMVYALTKLVEERNKRRGDE